MLIGEAPGQDEEKLGLPFVGRAGKLLSLVLKESGIDEQTVYISNVCKCRPPDNRKPNAKEGRICEDYLLAEVAAVAPTRILAMGDTAFRFVRAWERGVYRIGEARGRLEKAREELAGAEVWVSYHPAAVLRNPSLLPYFERDLQTLCRVNKTRRVEGAPRLPRKVGSVTVTDVETVGLKPWAADTRLVCQGVAYAEGEPVVFWPSAPDGWMQGTVVGHNVKFDLHWLGVTPTSVRDTMIMAHLIDENRPSLRLEALARAEMNAPSWKIDVTDVAKFPKSELEEYNKRDIIHTRELHDVFWPRIQEEGLERAARLDHECLIVLLEMERNGFSIDRGLLETLISRSETQVLQSYEAIGSGLGRLFNPLSNKQVQDELYDRRGFAPGRKTSTGRSVDIDTLEKLRFEHPDCTLLTQLVDFRGLTKMRGMLRGLLKFVDDTGRIHADYKLTGTPTGRLSCVEPNIQNVPKSDDVPMRSVFVSRWGDKGVLLNADYSQLELRVGAWYSRDPAMLDAFAQGLDIHERTRAAIFGAEEKPGQRTTAKAVNFGTFYGAGAKRIAMEAGVTIPEAQILQRKFFAAFPVVRQWVTDVRKLAQADWELEQAFGRRRHFILGGVDKRQEAHLLNSAVNFPVQGVAADITKAAMIKLHAELRSFDARMVAQVHDSIIIDAPKEEVPRLLPVVEGVMRDPGLSDWGVSFDVPLNVEIGVGRNWKEAD
jgi:uracil-DNA glycosylase family 4